MTDTAHRELDTFAEVDALDERYRLTGGIFTKRQVLALEVRHIVGPALRVRRARLDRKPA